MLYANTAATNLHNLIILNNRLWTSWAQDYEEYIRKTK